MVCGYARLNPAQPSTCLAKISVHSASPEYSTLDEYDRHKYEKDDIEEVTLLSRSNLDLSQIHNSRLKMKTNKRGFLQTTKFSEDR